MLSNSTDTGQNSRRNRDRRAFAHALARKPGGTMAALEAQLKCAARLHYSKLIDTAVRIGINHPSVRARYQGRADMLAGLGVDEASDLVEYWRDCEIRRLANLPNYAPRTRLSLEVLTELQLILRYVRRCHRAEWRSLLAWMLYPDLARAS